MKIEYRIVLMVISFLLSIALGVSAAPLAMWYGDFPSVAAVIGAAGWACVIIVLARWAKENVSHYWDIENLRVQKECYRIRAAAAEEKLLQIYKDYKV